MSITSSAAIFRFWKFSRYPALLQKFAFKEAAQSICTSYHCTSKQKMGVEVIPISPGDGKYFEIKNYFKKNVNRPNMNDFGVKVNRCLDCVIFSVSEVFSVYSYEKRFFFADECLNVSITLLN